MGTPAPATARAFHVATFAVAAFALGLQLLLIIQGHGHVATETDPDIAAVDGPDLATRLIRFFSYLTIWSNALVAGTALTLALRVDRDSTVWRALRLNAVVICFGGGLVHFFFLRPLLDLSGWDLLADKLLHMVVPLLALVGWLTFGPRGRAAVHDLGPFLVVPVFWLVYTLVRGAFVDWYPYPFLDVDLHGYGIVALNCLGISALMLAIAYAAIRLDKVLDKTPDGERSDR